MEFEQIRRIAQETDALCTAVIGNPTDEEAVKRLREGLSNFVVMDWRASKTLPLHIYGHISQAATYATFLYEALDPSQRRGDSVLAALRVGRRADDLQRVLREVLSHRD
jgi:hypothetical protein